MLRFALIIPIALHVLFSAQLRADAPKLDIPDEPSQAKADALVKQLFKADYASNDPAARRTLAKKLLQQAHDEKTDPAPRFVLFREARILAASCGDIATALLAVDQMSKVFVIDSVSYKSAIIQSAARTVNNQEDAAIYLSAGISIVDHLAADRDFAAAAKLLPPLIAVASQMKNRLIISGVRNKVQYLKDAQLEFDRLKIMMSRPGGELAAGKFACFFDDDWDTALTRFANAGDAKIKDIAKKDLAHPTMPADRFALANEWWDFAQKQPGIGKTSFESRARYWYKQAFADLGGLQRLSAQRRIASSLGAPEDATLFGGHAYTTSTATYGWNEARLVCQLAGGHLAYIESPEEWNFILKLATGPPRYWLGATDQEEDGQWHWLNGEPLTFKAWGPGQPDNHMGIQHFIYAAHGTWDDAGREEPCAPICEWE